MTNCTLVPFSKIAQFNHTDIKYAAKDEDLREFLSAFPEVENFEEVIAQRAKYPVDRALLVEVLEDQYKSLDILDDGAQSLIAKLKQPDTLTVTTAHQPIIFGGPAYVLYKIISTIKLAETLESRYSSHNFVPVFVIGSEDHDFEEISKTWFFGKEVRWENDEEGPVGGMSVDTLAPAVEEVIGIFGSSKYAEELTQTIRDAYSGEYNFSHSTILLLHKILGHLPFLIFNMSDRRLKKKMIPFFLSELQESRSIDYVRHSQAKLEQKGYSPQAYAREINLFYIKDELRERIEKSEDGKRFDILNTDISFSNGEMEAEVTKHPERFSPNVVLRPVYQEKILPNVAYVGGGGELAYWMERKEQFSNFDIPFPILVRRDSALWIDKTNMKRLTKLEFEVEDVIKDEEELKKQYLREHTGDTMDLDDSKKVIAEEFDQMSEKIRRIDPTLKNTVGAEKQKVINSIENLEKRIERAEKQKNDTTMNQIETLKEKLFPGGNLQERKENFMSFYLRYGKTYPEELLRHFDPLEMQFKILSEEL